MTRMGVVTAVFSTALFAGGVTAADFGSAAAAEFAPVCRVWNVVATPNSAKGTNLTSVDAFDASNAWAVGHVWKADGTRDGAPVAMRWDGKTWTDEPLPDLAYLGVQPTLEAVGIAPTADPWVVGHLRDGRFGRNAPLILRWSGGFWETYRVTLLDSFVPRYPLFRDVAAITANDAWAVGEAETAIKGALEPFAAHWDGTAWSEVAVPGTAGGTRVLTAVSATGPKAVWAVGYDVDLDTKNKSFARIYRWEGGAWSVVDQPAATKAGSALRDLVVLAPDDIWAVGEIGTDAGIFLHWDGSTWTSYAGPANADPRSVDGSASNDVWASGSTGFYHWDGTSWSLLPSTGADTIARRAVAVAGLCDAWSITSWGDAADSTSRVERLGSAAPAPEPPATPIKFVANPMSSRQIALAWLPGGDPADQRAFVIERCDEETRACELRFTMIGRVAGHVTSFIDSALEPATFYMYRIYAVNSAGASEPTAPVSARTLAEGDSSPLPEPVPGRTQAEPGPYAPDAPLARPAMRTEVTAASPLMPQQLELPPTPVSLSVTPIGARRIALKWLPGKNDAARQTYFVIERCDSEARACQPFTVIGKVSGRETSFLDSGLRAATAYTYRVYAVNNAGASEPTAPEMARTFLAPVPLPNGPGPR